MKELSSRQCVCITCILGFAVRAFCAPVALVSVSGRDAYFVMAMQGLLDLLLLALIVIAVKKSPDEDVFECVTRVCGAVIGKIFCAVVALVTLFSANLAVWQTMLFFGTSSYERFTPWLMVLLTLAFLFVVARRRLRSLARLTELALPFLLICVAVLIALIAIGKIDMRNLAPFLHDKSAVLNSLSKSGAVGFSFIPAILFIGNTKIEKRFALKTGVAAVVSVALPVLFCATLSAVFAFMPTLISYGSSIGNISQYGVSGMFGRLDMIVYTVLASALTLYTAFAFYTSATALSRLCKAKISVFIILAELLTVYSAQIWLPFGTMETLCFSFVSSVTYTVCTVVVVFVAVLCAIIRARKTGGEKGGKNTGIIEKVGNAREGKARDRTNVRLFKSVRERLTVSAKFEKAFTGSKDALGISQSLNALCKDASDKRSGDKNAT